MSSQRPVLLPWIRQFGTPRNQTATIQIPSRREVIQEATFVQMLRFERRRTERSGKQLMLVLISSEHFRGKPGSALINSVVATLATRIRETDVLGWYERDKTIGILMTEIGNGDDVTVEIIMNKISRALENNVTSDKARLLTVTYRLFPHAEDVLSGKRTRNGFYPDLSPRRPSNMQTETAKRLMDIFGSVVALVVFLPAIVAITLLVKLTSEGPILFSQERVGQHGRLFRFFKFRTMHVNNDSQIHREYVTKLIAGKEDPKANGGIYKLANDPRITPLGRFLRKSSLDELPQLFNVLMSDMSLVGPRPPLPYEYERYQVWHKRRVMELKPGLTGLWQVKGRSRTTFDEMVRMDLRYANTKSLWTDCTILLQTPGAVLSGRGAR
jgi:lipopolysaccharide/colanic/teichoic acid biosynthesis glycosyltransferase